MSVGGGFYYYISDASGVRICSTLKDHNICTMQDLHGIMEVTKETTDVDSIVSLLAKIIDDVVVEAEKKIKSTVEVDEKKRKNRRDDERKRGKKLT